MLRYVVAIALLAHGIGHAMGFLASWSSIPMGFSKDPWVLPGEFTIDSAVRRAFGLLWLVTMIGFIGAGLGVLGVAVQHEWWRSLAIASAVISLVVIVPWWNTMGPEFPPLLFDLLVLVALLGPWRDQITRVIGWPCLRTVKLPRHVHILFPNTCPNPSNPSRGLHRSGEDWNGYPQGTVQGKGVGWGCSRKEARSGAVGVDGLLVRGYNPGPIDPVRACRPIRNI